MNEKQPTLTKTFRAQWAVMTFYERFDPYAKPETKKAA